NGAAWSSVPGPSAGVFVDHEFFAVGAASANDVWAVGTYVGEEAVAQTLIGRWNGTSWSIVPSPNAGQYDNVLYDLAVISANDVWAVGFYISDTGAYRALSLHWNGTTWTVVPSPPVGSGSTTLYGVDGVASNDVWAVGYFLSAGYRSRALLLHWDGTTWNVTPGPSLRTDYSAFNMVDVISANDAWAVGSYIYFDD